MAQMTKRERLSATITGQEVDRTAVALWRHFPGDDQRLNQGAFRTPADRDATFPNEVEDTAGIPAGILGGAVAGDDGDAIHLQLR